MCERSVVVGEPPLVAGLGGKNHLYLDKVLWLDAHVLATLSFSQIYRVEKTKAMFNAYKYFENQAIKNQFVKQKNFV